MDGQSIERLTPSARHTLVGFFDPAAARRRFHGIFGFLPNGIAIAPDGTVYVDTDGGNGYSDRAGIVAFDPTFRASRLLWSSRPTS